ncbi:hypothetical protein CHH55_01125 [Niallia circulans]|nr:hypothetical protein CHH55_01125 [Niallia circulans]
MRTCSRRKLLKNDIGDWNIIFPVAEVNSQTRIRKNISNHLFGFFYKRKKVLEKPFIGKEKTEK